MVVRVISRSACRVGDGFTGPGFRLTYIDGVPKQHTVHEFMLSGIVGDCISELYPMFTMKSFRKTTRPKSQANDDSANGVVEIEGSSGTFNVVSDPTPPPWAINIMRATDSRGLTPKFDPKSPNGESPFWTYACPSCDTKNVGRPGEDRYPDLYKNDSYFRVQVHELGAALTNIRNKYYPAGPPMPGDYEPRPDGGLSKLYPGGSHSDEGPAMEDCVGRKYYQMNGLTPVTK